MSGESAGSPTAASNAPASLAHARPAAGGPPPLRRQYVNYIAYKVDPKWRFLPEAERRQGKQAFVEAVEAFKDTTQVIAYTLVGIRAEADLLLWRISYDLEKFQEQSTRMLNTGLGRHLDTRYSFLATTRRSIYIDKHLHPDQESSRTHIVPGQTKYLFIYPFWKTIDWYLLPMPERQKMMDVHIAIGHKYPAIKINTGYSFGLDDQEFVVAFEGDDPHAFMDLVMELREIQGRKYTLKDTPILTCLRKELPEALETLGG